MAHRRSGAQRKLAQKRARQREEERHQAAVHSEVRANEASKGAAGAPAVTTTKGSKQVLKPSTQEVIAAVASLCFDQLKPFGRLLRKRIAERHAADVSTEIGGDVADNLPDVDVPHLRAVCDQCSQLRVEPEEGGDWSVTLSGCPSSFVDIHDNTDNYGEKLWADAVAYFQSCSDEEMTLPGGRYSCAQALLARGLPFLEGRSLGQVCHIVQLAVSTRKVLGYLQGAIVPYNRSQSMIKERCAQQQRQCANVCEEAAALTCATWENARSGLKAILESVRRSQDNDGPGTVPLSNVKRLFRSEQELELSETILGHARLSELLQDERFQDICSVRLEKHGYVVVQKVDFVPKSQKTQAGDDGLAADHVDVVVASRKASNGRIGIWADEPLCLEDAAESMEYFNFGPTPGQYDLTPVPSPTPVPNFSSHLTSQPSPTVGSTGFADPISLSSPIAGLFGPTPLPSPAPTWQAYLPPNLPAHIEPRTRFCTDDPLDLADIAETFDVPAFGATPGPFGPSPPLSEFAAACGDGAMLQAAPNFLFQALQHFALQPYFGIASEALLGSHLAEETHAAEFCPGEPLDLEELEVSSAAPLFGPTPGPFAPSPLRSRVATTKATTKASGVVEPRSGGAVPKQKWFNLSPSTLSKDGKVGSIVQNTFIHAAPQPPTPVPGVPRRRRSASMPKNVGSGRSAFETTCHALSFLPRPIVHSDDAGGDESQSTSARSISQNSLASSPCISPRHQKQGARPLEAVGADGKAVTSGFKTLH